MRPRTGYGYREIRDMPILPSLPAFRSVRPSAAFNSRFGFDDEQEVDFDVTSVHAALAEKICNVHIDKFGFVMRGPFGAFLTLDFGQHTADELGLEEKIAPLLGRGIGRMFRVDGKEVGNWIARNINLDLPNYRSGYRKGVGVSVTPTSNLKVSAKFTAECGCSTNMEEDFGIPIPDGWSVGLGRPDPQVEVEQAPMPTQRSSRRAAPSFTGLQDPDKFGFSGFVRGPRAWRGP